MKYNKKSKAMIGLSVLLTTIFCTGGMFVGAYGANRSTAAVQQQSSSDYIYRTESPVPTVTQKNGSEFIYSPDISVSKVQPKNNTVMNFGSYTYTNPGNGNFNNFENVTLFQSYHYYDGYIIGIRCQKANIDKETFPKTIQMKTEKNYAVSFTADTQAYAENKLALDAIMKGIQSMSGMADQIENPVYIIVQIVGPYKNASNDELAERFYKEKNITFFSAVVPSTSMAKKTELAELAYQDDEISFFSILQNGLSDEMNYDALAERAYKDKKISFFSVMLPNISKEKKLELADLAYKENQISFSSVLSNYVSDDTNYDALAEKAYKDQKLSYFSIVVSNVSPSKRLELANLAYEEDQISYFSVIKNHLTAEEKQLFKNRAADDNKISFFSVLAY